MATDNSIREVKLVHRQGKHDFLIETFHIGNLILFCRKKNEKDLTDPSIASWYNYAGYELWDENGYEYDYEADGWFQDEGTGEWKQDPEYAKYYEEYYRQFYLHHQNQLEQNRLDHQSGTPPDPKDELDQLSATLASNTTTTKKVRRLHVY